MQWPFWWQFSLQGKKGRKFPGKNFLVNSIIILNTIIVLIEAVARRCSFKKAVLKSFAKFTGKRFLLNKSLSYLIKLQASACNFIKKETLAQVFSGEFCEIFRNNFFSTTPPLAAPAFTIAGNCNPYFSLLSLKLIFLLYSTLAQHRLTWLCIEFLLLDMNIWYSSFFKILWSYLETNDFFLSGITRVISCVWHYDAYSILQQ